MSFHEPWFIALYVVFSCQILSAILHLIAAGRIRAASHRLLASACEAAAPLDTSSPTGRESHP